MSDPVRFLNAFAHSLGVMTLYPEGHPSRERAVDSAFDELNGLTLPGGHLPAFTFLEDEVVFGRERLRDTPATCSTADLVCEFDWDRVRSEDRIMAWHRGALVLDQPGVPGVPP
jgi:hypothetical protein